MNGIIVSIRSILGVQFVMWGMQLLGPSSGTRTLCKGLEEYLDWRQQELIRKDPSLERYL